MDGLMENPIPEEPILVEDVEEVYEAIRSNLPLVQDSVEELVGILGLVFEDEEVPEVHSGNENIVHYEVLENGSVLLT